MTEAPKFERLVMPKRTPAFEATLFNEVNRRRNQRERKLAQAKDGLRRDLLTGRQTAATRRMERQIAGDTPLLVRY